MLATAGVALFISLMLFMRRRKEYGYSGRDRRLILWNLLTMAAGTAGLLLFILTEDMSGYMTTADSRTLPQLIIFAVCLISASAYIRRSARGEDAEYDSEL
jgi:hypothetical protein